MWLTVLCTIKTYSVTLAAVVAMIMHPDAQARAQNEIDTVVGTHRLPSMEDKGSLPYVEAFIKETMRWSPALPLSKFHRIYDSSLVLTDAHFSQVSRGVRHKMIITKVLPLLHVKKPLILSPIIISLGYHIPKGTTVLPNVW